MAFFRVQILDFRDFNPSFSYLGAKNAKRPVKNRWVLNRGQAARFWLYIQIILQAGVIRRSLDSSKVVIWLSSEVTEKVASEPGLGIQVS